MTYEEWIEQYVASQPSRFVRGKCADATSKMVEAFPELRRACGFAFCAWGRDQHWWCVAPDGAIVDPTAEQFASCGGVFLYEEIDPNNEEDRKRVPTGRCMNCGDDVYEGKTFCSEACERETIAALEVTNGEI